MCVSYRINCNAIAGVIFTNDPPPTTRETIFRLSGVLIGSLLMLVDTFKVVPSTFSMLLIVVAVMFLVSFVSKVE